MASIVEVKSGWRIRWRNPDGSAGSYTVPDKAQAQRMAAEATVEERNGRAWVPPARRREEGMEEPVEDAAVRWLQAIQDTVRPRTLEIYANDIEKSLIPALGNGRKAPRVADFTPEAVRAAVRVWVAKWAPETVKSRLTSVHAFAKFLGRGNLRDAMDDIRAIKVKSPPPAPITVGFAELNTIMEYVGSPGSKAYTFCAIARCTGLRNGEILGIKWGDVAGLSGPSPTITIPHDNTKGGRSGRVIPVAPVLAAYLTAHRPEDVGTADRVVGWDAVTYSSGRIAVAIRIAVERGELAASYAEQKGRAHLFRKGFIQGLRRLKADPDAVEWLVGHSLGIKAHYIHMEEAAREAVALVPPLPTPTPAPNVVQLRA